MNLYNLDSKITDKSYEILNSHIEEQKQKNMIRVNEIRNNCRDILERHGIFEDKKNGIIYQAMEKELDNLERNIDYFSEYHFEELTKNKIDVGIENISSKIDSLEHNIDFIYEDDGYRYNKTESENNLKNMLFTYFESYKANTIDLLLKSGYSKNMIEDIEDDILEYVTSKSSDILTEKLSQDRIKSFFSLNKSLNDLSVNIINEAEARYKCDLNGMPFDELKDKRESVRKKAEKIKDIRMQIASLDLKTNELNGMVQKLNNERILL